MHLSVEGVEEEAGAANFADLVASLYIAAYFVVLFKPFVLLRDLPGSAAWAALPFLGLLALVLAPRDHLIRAPVSASILALAVWSAASIAWSDRFGASFFAIRSEVPPLIMLCLVVGSMPRTNVVRTLLWVFAGVGVWSLATSLTMPMSRIAYLGEGPTLSIQEGWRGTFRHKNLLGIFALLGFTTTLAFVRHRGVKSAMLGLFVVIVLGTRSATVAGGIVVVGVVWSWLTWIGGINSPKSRALAKLVSVVLLVAAVASALALLPIFVAFYGKDLTFSGRTDIWAATVDTIRQRPVFGHGLGGVWGDRFDPMTADLHRRIGFQAAHAHNGALDVLLSVGFVGLALFLALVTNTIRLAIRSLRTEGAAYGRWALVSLAAIVMMSLSEPLFEGAMLGMLALIWTVLAGFAIDSRRQPLGVDRRRSTFDVAQPPLGGSSPLDRDLLAATPGRAGGPPPGGRHDSDAASEITN